MLQSSRPTFQLLFFVSFLFGTLNLNAPAFAQSDAESMLLPEIETSQATLEAPSLTTDNKAHQRAALSFAPYHPLGSYSTATAGNVNLADAGWSLMPTVSLGWLSPQSQVSDFLTDWGVAVSLGGMSENFSSATDIGQSVNGTLSTWTLALQPSYRFHWRSNAKISTVIRGDLGLTEMHLQTSNSAAQLNLQDESIGYALGFEWDPSIRYGLTAMYYERFGFMTASPWNAGGSGLEFGTVMTW